MTHVAEDARCRLHFKECLPHCKVFCLYLADRLPQISGNAGKDCRHRTLVSITSNIITHRPGSATAMSQTAIRCKASLVQPHTLKLNPMPQTMEARCQKWIKTRQAFPVEVSTSHGNKTHSFGIVCSASLGYHSMNRVCSLTVCDWKYS